jgi:competence protein ComEC
VLEALRPKVFWDGAYLGTNDSYRAALAVSARRGIQWHRVHPGDTLRVDGVLITVLAPDSAWTVASKDPNDASTVLMVEYGHTRFILMGDAEGPEEAWIRQRWGDSSLHADVLKAGHHGSRTSSTPGFLDAVHPGLAVISVGAGNTYGHPNRPVLQALSARHAIILRTDQLGSVVVSTDGTRLRIAGGDGHWTALPSRPPVRAHAPP